MAASSARIAPPAEPIRAPKAMADSPGSTRLPRIRPQASERTLTRLFHRATGQTPLRYQQELRLERAEHLTMHGETVEAAARAVGFEDARMLRRLRARG